MLTCQLQSKERIMPSLTPKTQDNSIRENVYRVIKENIAALQLAPGTTVSTQ